MTPDGAYLDSSPLRGKNLSEVQKAPVNQRRAQGVDASAPRIFGVQSTYNEAQERQLKSHHVGKFPAVKQVPCLTLPCLSGLAGDGGLKESGCAVQGTPSTRMGKLIFKQVSKCLLGYFSLVRSPQQAESLVSPT